MGKGRPKARLVLTDEEREHLARGARAAHSTQAFAIRCRIVLACADGATNIEVATRLNVSPATVGKWRSRFAAARLSGLADEVRTGRPTSVRPEQVDRVVAATLGGTPAPARRWSRASMAAHTGLSASTVGRIWRQFDLRPHLQDGPTLAADPGFVASVVALVGLYRHPPEQALVLCATPRDDRFAVSGGPAPGGPEPYRPGSPAPGEEDGPHRRRRAAAYRRFLVAVDRAVPAGLLVHVIADDPASHGAAAVRGWLTRHPRFHLHLTPGGGVWADQVRRWSALLAARHPDDAGPARPGVCGPVPPDAVGPAPDGADGTTGVGEGPTRWISTVDEVRKALARHHQRTSDASTSTGRPYAPGPPTAATGM
ncbi:helix-turn-helix domain-containing protein [Micromonospora antibiotica]|uniref:Helix-turn-helix domain-containing protein n=1 Tax=Micromonospora antibiotica TaxID=2807623 RepID=A0ABS3V666_9ACTN|nr:helix-turn-helix domain-containing protein [Micromonospora antibiotica]MBO4161090.1 helix-turn-helix domain-containing protein [Micromonospora antibiotica]